MKQNVKVFLIALVIGMAVSYFVCYKFGDMTVSWALNPVATCFYTSSYNNLEEAMMKQQENMPSIIYNQNGIYYVVIGVYTEEETVSLMESFFLDQNINFRKLEVKVDNTYLKSSETYEKVILTSSKEYYANLNSSLITLFNEYIN